MELKNQIDRKKLPKHVAVIMDGNGRWAKNIGQVRIVGHENGITSVREVAEGAAELGIENVTLYAFSTENWNRPKDEINALMSLMVHTLKSELKTLQDNKISLRAIGDLESLPADCQAELKEVMLLTQHNTQMNLILALSYSSYWEITEAVKSIATQCTNGTLNINEITPETISANLQSAPYPFPELMIRTSGELRISNFLLWQLAYSELYFTEVLWPDFRKQHLYEALINYQNRERRYGKTSEQIAQENNS